MRLTVIRTRRTERMAPFFHFCKQREWIESNPVISITLPEVTRSPTLPCSRKHMEKIAAGCDEFTQKGV